MPEEIQTEEEKEVEGEEVPLDEAPVEEEPEESPDSSTLESDEANDESSTEEDLTDDNPTGEEPEKPFRKGISRFLRKKWVLLSSAGVFAGILGVMLGNGVSWDLPWGAQSSSKRIQGVAGEKGNGLVDTGLQPFYLPLQEGSENIAIKLDIKVRWEAEALKKYRERPAFIRNSLLTYFLRVAKSKEGFEAQKSKLESEIGKVLEHSLAVKNIKVSLDSVTPI